LRDPVDPYHFILLNLFFSFGASGISSASDHDEPDRQDTKDAAQRLDFDVNRRAESEIQGLAHKLNLLGDKIDDVEEFAADETVLAAFVRALKRPAQSDFAPQWSRPSGSWFQPFCWPEFRSERRHAEIRK